MLNGTVAVGTVNIFSTSGRDYDYEELADMAISKIINIGPEVPSPIREQAFAFRDKVKNIIMHYLKAAQECERRTIAIKVRELGNATLADIIEKGL